MGAEGRLDRVPQFVRHQRRMAPSPRSSFPANLTLQRSSHRYRLYSLKGLFSARLGYIGFRPPGKSLAWDCSGSLVTPTRNSAPVPSYLELDDRLTKISVDATAKLGVEVKPWFPLGWVVSAAMALISLGLLAFGAYLISTHGPLTLALLLLPTGFFLPIGF